MITSPIIVLFVLVACLLGLAVYSLSVAQSCSDRLEGVLPTELPARTLLQQQARAERTAAWAFGLGFLAAMLLAGTVDFAHFSRF